MRDKSYQSAFFPFLALSRSTAAWRCGGTGKLFARYLWASSTWERSFSLQNCHDQLGIWGWTTYRDSGSFRYLSLALKRLAAASLVGALHSRQDWKGLTWCGIAVGNCSGNCDGIAAVYFKFVHIIYLSSNRSGPATPEGHQWQLSPVNKILRRTKNRRIKMRIAIKSFMTAPLWAMLLSLIVTITKPLKHALEYPSTINTEA